MSNRSNKAVWGAVLALALLQPLPAAAAPDQAAKLDKTLADSPSSGEPRDVIIRMKPGHESAVRNTIRRQSGAEPQTHALIGALSIRLTPRQIAELANDPDVAGVSIDADVSAVASVDTQLREEERGIGHPDGRRRGGL